MRYSTRRVEYAHRALISWLPTGLSIPTHPTFIKWWYLRSHVIFIIVNCWVVPKWGP